MTEARIECLCSTFNLADIQLMVRRGDIVWVSEEIARSSEDLRLAVRSGAVSVVYAKRCSVSRSPPPPNVRINYRALRGGFVRLQENPPQVTPPVPPPQGLDAKALEDAVANGIAKAIQGLLTSGVLVPGGVPITGSGNAYAAPASVAVVTSEPVYIPSNLVPSDNATTITIAESSSEGTELEASAAALKATRKRKITPTETA